VQPSPTTGKLPFLQCNNSANQFGDASESFSFKPSLDLKPSASSILEKKVFLFQVYESHSFKKEQKIPLLVGLSIQVLNVSWRFYCCRLYAKLKFVNFCISLLFLDNFFWFSMPKQCCFFKT
jgi:hypothetical protein